MLLATPANVNVLPPARLNPEVMQCVEYNDSPPVVASRVSCAPKYTRFPDTLTTRLVDTVTTPMLIKTVTSGKIKPKQLFATVEHQTVSFSSEILNEMPALVVDDNGINRKY